MTATWLAFAATAVSAGDVVPASCPCGAGGGHGWGGPLAWAAPPLLEEPSPFGSPMPPALGLPGAPAPVAEAVAPPPGTLGTTYQRRSWSIPAEKHPRVAMLDVRVNGAAGVNVFNTYEYREWDELDGFRNETDPGLWHFESKPLVPGVPHIYRVEARVPGPSGESTQVRYVRLIWGRRVELTF